MLHHKQSHPENHPAGYRMGSKPWEVNDATHQNQMPQDTRYEPQSATDSTKKSRLIARFLIRACSLFVVGCLGFVAMCGFLWVLSWGMQFAANEARSGNIWPALIVINLLGVPVALGIREHIEEGIQRREKRQAAALERGADGIKGAE